jgi:hypothetical protein
VDVAADSGADWESGCVERVDCAGGVSGGVDRNVDDEDVAAFELIYLLTSSLEKKPTEGA